MADVLTADMIKQRDYTAALAHEVKTPMTSIIGFSALLHSRDLIEEQRIKAAVFKQRPG